VKEKHELSAPYEFTFKYDDQHKCNPAKESKAFFSAS